MLQMQVNYLNYKEVQRHNLVAEAQEWAKVTLEKLKLEETKRHNLTTEQLEAKKLAETIRHNLVSERQSDVKLGIEMFLAKTKEGELLLKQMVEPGKLEAERIKAGASVVQAQAKASEAATKAYLSTFKGSEVDIAKQKADADTLRSKTGYKEYKYGSWKDKTGAELHRGDQDIEKRGQDLRHQDNVGRIISDAAAKSRLQYTTRLDTPVDVPYNEVPVPPVSPILPGPTTPLLP